MNKSIALRVALAFVIVASMAPNASALCNPPKSVGTYNGTSGNWSYWHSTLGALPGASLVGKLWSGATDLTGSCNTACTGCGYRSGFLYFGVVYPGDVGLNLSLGDACQGDNVCPIGSISVLAGVTSGGSTEFLATQGLETAGFFDFSSTEHAMRVHPRPRVTRSSRSSGGHVLLSISIDATTPALFDGVASQITGYNILSALAVSDPGRLEKAYTFLTATSGGSGGTPATADVTVDCSIYGKDQWLVAQIVTVAGPSPFVGPPSRIRCTTALADPKPFKVINKGVTVTDD